MNLKQRFRAGGLHLLISVAAALIACAVIFFIWYPYPYDLAQGVSRLVLIMIAVDVVIGPLITTIVFNRAKKELKFDLAIVATVQLAALIYGLHAIYGGRPAYLVYVVDRFELVPIQDVDRASMAKADPAFRPGIGVPPRFAARLPEDVEMRNKLMFEAGFGGPDLAQRPEFFVPLADEMANLLKRVRPLDELQRINELDETTWQTLLADFKRDEAELSYLPMSAKVRDGAVILDRATGEILGIRMLTPAYGPIHQRPKEGGKVLSRAVS